jgi:GNAT superfamily N-acetyltransferase
MAAYNSTLAFRLWRETVLSIRPATINDVPLLSTMIREMADFENALQNVTNTEADLARDGFGPEPKFRVLIAEWNQEAVGYALFFAFYSTWRGRQIFLEDLFVREPFRGKAIGTSLMAQVAKIAVEENCRAMRWEVLNWNRPAIALYESLGVTLLDELRTVLLIGEALTNLADRASKR